MRAFMQSFDRTETVAGYLARPDRYRHLFAALDGPGPAIPRGAGLSYCAASAGEGVTSVLSARFDRVLAFDETRGVVQVEPGVTVGGLLAFAVPRGWYPPVLPGYPTITVGGCLGCNVHGKGGARKSYFGDYVDELTVFHPESGEVTCSPTVDPERFQATVGGFGLTGFITRASLRLLPLSGGSVYRARETTPNLLAAVEQLEAGDSERDRLYSWNDLSRRGEAFGRGVVYCDRFDEPPLPWSMAPAELGGSGPPRARMSLLNRWSTPLMNLAYGWSESHRPGALQLDLATAAFPIQGKEIYYSLFGRRGFREYQMLVPRSAWAHAVHEVRQRLERARVPVALGSLKLLQGEASMMRFAGTGVCLTLDVPATGEAMELFAGLDEVVVGVGGIMNPAKDGRLSGEVARQAFPGYDDFRQAIDRADPSRRLDSSLRRRLFG